MSEIVKTFLLAGDNFTSGIHLRQPGFTYSAVKRLQKTRKESKKLKETDNLQYICQNELDKCCFDKYIVMSWLMEILKF